MISIEVSSNIFSQYGSALQEFTARVYVANEFLESGNGNGGRQGAPCFSHYWLITEAEEAKQLQLAQRVFATVPLAEIDSNDWAGILAERGNDD